ncbi:MAG: metallopeptidase TldD-related protein [Planctomycetota bacterium]|nr:metallopeptidase TldD-related protein [Planctomycetota bacterium]
MLARDQAKAFCERVLSRADGDEIEVIVGASESNALRMAESAPSEQNASTRVRCSIRVVRDGRHGRAEVESLGDAAIDRTIAAARAAAAATPVSSLPPFAGASTGDDGGQPEDAVRAVAGHAPAAKVAQVRGYLDRVRASGAVATGFYETKGESVTYANTAGCFRHAFQGRSWFSSTVLADDGAGVAHAGATGENLAPDRIDAAGQRALDKALSSRAPRNIDPGDYRVLLEPIAVAELVMFVSWTGMSGRRLLDGASFLSGKIGERVLSEQLTIRDDAGDARFRSPRFDLEGQDRRAVTIVDAGIGKGVVWDRATALEGQTETTGHAMPQPCASGPEPDNVIMEAANGVESDMLARLGNGLLVTQFHYTNVIDPVPVTVTGMTRNGTFLVENGEIVGPVKNMRFTQSIIAALTNVDAVGDDSSLVDVFFGGTCLVPSLLLPAFRFTSATEF